MPVFEHRFILWLYSVVRPLAAYSGLRYDPARLGTCLATRPVLRGDQVDIVCNECDAVLRTVPVAEIRRTLDEMELSLDVASELCPECGSVNLFPGFSRMLAFRCRECGEGVKIEDA